MKKMISFVVVNFAIIAFSNWLVLWIIHPMWAESWIKIGLPITFVFLCILYPQINRIHLWYARHLLIYATVVAILFAYWFFSTWYIEGASVGWALKTAVEGASFGQVFGMCFAYPLMLAANYYFRHQFFRENKVLVEVEG